MLPDWEIWLDVHFSSIIAKWLCDDTGLNVKSSYTLGLNGLSDKEIYLKAKAAGNVILISKNTDFPELISRLGAPPKLIHIKIGNCDNKILFRFIRKEIEQAIKLLTTFRIDIIELEQ